MSNNHVKIHTTELDSFDLDLPAGVNRHQFEELGRRADQWVNWRAGRIPEPLWHYPAIRRNYDTPAN